MSPMHELEHELEGELNPVRKVYLDAMLEMEHLMSAASEAEHENQAEQFFPLLLPLAAKLAPLAMKGARPQLGAKYACRQHRAPGGSRPQRHAAGRAAHPRAAGGERAAQIAHAACSAPSASPRQADSGLPPAGAVCRRMPPRSSAAEPVRMLLRLVPDIPLGRASHEPSSRFRGNSRRGPPAAPGARRQHRTPDSQRPPPSGATPAAPIPSDRRVRPGSARDGSGVMSYWEGFLDIGGVSKV